MSHLRQMLVGSVAAASAVLLMACATTVPPELAKARSMYTESKHSETATLAPAELESARETLAEAEKSWDCSGDSTKTRDLAYMAQRRVQVADLQANVYAMTQKKAGAAALAARTDAGRERLTQQQELASERKARKQAEKDLEVALKKLQDLGTVRKEERGTVIVMSGGVLFQTGEATIQPGAESKLNRLAEVLKQADSSNIVIEGYTDSTGPAAMNQKLSLERARAVRDVLMAQGIEPNKILAVGFGEERPIAANNTATGRALNRRVEIIVGEICPVTPGH